MGIVFVFLSICQRIRSDLQISEESPERELLRTQPSPLKSPPTKFSSCEGLPSACTPCIHPPKDPGRMWNSCTSGLHTSATREVQLFKLWSWNDTWSPVWSSDSCKLPELNPPRVTQQDYCWTEVQWIPHEMDWKTRQKYWWLGSQNWTSWNSWRCLPGPSERFIWRGLKCCERPVFWGSPFSS